MIKEPQRVTQSPPCAQKKSLNNYTKQRNPSKRGKTIEIEDAQKKFSYKSSFLPNTIRKEGKPTTQLCQMQLLGTVGNAFSTFFFGFFFFWVFSRTQNANRKKVKTTAAK